MNKTLGNVMLGLVLLLGAATLSAQGVELNPAYLTGHLVLSNGTYADHVSSFYVYAYGTDSSGSSITANTSGNPDGSYTLTLNAPADGSARSYSLQAYGYLKNNFEFIVYQGTLSVQKGQTYSQDFTLSIANLEIKIAADNGNILNWYAYWSPYEYAYKSYAAPTGSIDEIFEIPANQDLSFAFGSVYPQDSTNFDYVSLPSQNVAAVAAGETALVSWNLHFPAKAVVQTGTLTGSIRISGMPDNLQFNYHWLVAGSLSLWLYQDGPFSDSTLPAGDYYPSWFETSYSKSNPDGSSQGITAYWPYDWFIPGYPNPDHFTIPAGGTSTMDVDKSVGRANLTLNLTGTILASDLTASYARLDPLSPVGGMNFYQAYSNGNAQSIALVAPEGISRLAYYEFQINKTAASDGNFYNSSYYFYPLQSLAPTFTFVAGAAPLQLPVNVPTGTVTIKFSSTDGSLVSSPYLSGSGSVTDSSGATIGSANVSAYGPSTPLVENSVSFAGLPGTYTLNASAYVNGSNVTFSPKTVIVIEGVQTVLEINGPSLTVNSPTPETYTTDPTVTVAGTADDDSAVASVSVNGAAASLSSTNNPNAPHEVSFSLGFPLAKGVNKIVTKALDGSGKQALDTRFVYSDKGPPSFSFTPANGTTTPSGSITVSGTATDDNGVATILLNGQSLAFVSTNNPSDPNEVSFSRDVNLSDGPNTIAVVVTDSCKRVTSAAHIVTKADQDLTPPQLSPVSDLVLEQTDALGTAYVLTPPTATDDRDPNPVVSSDAPALFPPGTTTVTWLAQDASGNRSQEAQKVTVRDSRAPAIAQPSALSLEQVSAAGTAFTLPVPTVSDAVDPHPLISSNAPELFPGGSTVVTWTAVDASGNSSQVTQTVTVRDTTPPVLGALVDLSLEQASAAGTPNGLTPPTATDTVDPHPLVASDAPAILPAGITVVTWTATDASGNQAQATQNVTVRDTKPPVFPVLSPVTLAQTGPSGTSYRLPPPAVQDAVDPSPVLSSNAPSLFPVGTTIVTWTARDASGNASTAKQSVVVKDLTGPLLWVEPTRTILSAVRDRDRDRDHGMIPIWVWLKAVDAVDGNLTRSVELVSVTSDEAKVGKEPDIIILGRNLILLRAEADRRGNGRVYTLNYQVSDKSGNVTKVSRKIEVRTDPKVPAVDSGVAYTVLPDQRIRRFDSRGEGRYRDDRFDNGKHRNDQAEGGPGKN